MRTGSTSRAAYRAVTTINAPLRMRIDVATLLSCLRLDNRDPGWRPHISAFFSEVNLDIMMDMVVEGALTFDDLYKTLTYWKIEENKSARWIREMASVAVAEADGAYD